MAMMFQQEPSPVHYMVKNSFLDFVGNTEFGMQQDAQRCRAATSDAAFFASTPKAKQQPQLFNVTFKDEEPESEPITMPTIYNCHNKIQTPTNRRRNWSSFSEEEEQQ